MQQTGLIIKLPAELVEKLKPLALTENQTIESYVVKSLSEFAGTSLTISVGNLTIDRLNRSIVLNSAAIKVRPKCFDLLVVLATTPGRIFSKESLFEILWPRCSELSVVALHVSYLNAALNVCRRGSAICCERGRGYYLDSQVFV